MGRKRTRQAVPTASRKGIPSARSVRANSTIKMLLETTMPTIMTTPMSDITLRVVPVSSNTTITPVIPGGIASKMMKGSMKD